jgi:hypothetical protein
MEAGISPVNRFSLKYLENKIRKYINDHCHKILIIVLQLTSVSNLTRLLIEEGISPVNWFLSKYLGNKIRK